MQPGMVYHQVLNELKNRLTRLYTPHVCNIGVSVDMWFTHTEGF